MLIGCYCTCCEEGLKSEGCKIVMRREGENIHQSEEVYQNNSTGNAECVCGIGCRREYSFEYRNQFEVHLTGMV